MYEETMVFLLLVGMHIGKMFPPLTNDHIAPPTRHTHNDGAVIFLL